MSAAPAAPHSDGEEEEEYRRPSKRLKTAVRQAEDREEGEDELEEGEDSDSGSLPGEGEPAVDHRARWTCSQYRGGRKVRGAGRGGGGSIRSGCTSQQHPRISAFRSPNKADVEVVWLARARASVRVCCVQVLQLPPTEGCGCFHLLSSSLQKELGVMT